MRNSCAAGKRALYMLKERCHIRKVLLADTAERWVRNASKMVLSISFRVEAQLALWAVSAYMGGVVMMEVEVDGREEGALADMTRSFLLRKLNVAR